MKELIDTFLEEYEGAWEQFEKARYKNALILFSKSIFALCDLVIYQKLKKLPKNHTERFRVLEEYFPNIYPLVDELFGLYVDAYNKPIIKESCEHIQNGIKQITNTVEMPDQIKRIIR